MKFSNFATISLFLVASCSETLAYGPKTLSAKKQDRFFKCLLAMQGSDENKDARLSLDEYDTMVHNLGILLFDSPKEHLETSFYQDAVKASNPPAGTSQIDIYGADASNLFAVNKDRIEALQKVCVFTMKELTHHGHETDPPKILSLPVTMQEEYEEEEEKEEEEEGETTKSAPSNGERNLRGGNANN